MKWAGDKAIEVTLLLQGTWYTEITLIASQSAIVAHEN